MGGGSYSFTSRSTRAKEMGWDSKSTYEVFEQRNINSEMSPYGVQLRESRDSEEHPNSFPIIIALDVTGSMTSVPHYIVQKGLPMIMDKIIQRGIADPQILFMAIGDHEYDDSPLQVGQFESSDALLDHWLTKVYLEGGGGGNDSESYHLAWYFAARHTETDSFVKRGEKGVLITIGDEPYFKNVFKNDLRKIMGDGEYADYKTAHLLDMAQKTYHCHHIHIACTGAGSMESTKNVWRELMGDNLHIAAQREDVSTIIADIVCKAKGNSKVEEKITEDVREENAEVESSDYQYQFINKNKN